jgi:hypothetical protein
VPLKLSLLFPAVCHCRGRFGVLNSGRRDIHAVTEWQFLCHRQTIVVATVIGIAKVGVSRLKPTAPTVERGTVWTDTVKRGLRAFGGQIMGGGRMLQIPASTESTFDELGSARSQRPGVLCGHHARGL